MLSVETLNMAFDVEALILPPFGLIVQLFVKKVPA
jgi:hypothetical protein